MTMRIALTTVAVVVALGLAAGCRNEGQINSIEHTKKGARAYGQKQFETAVTEYKEAVDAWRDNHMAWYGLGNAYTGRQNWKDAADAFGEAVKLKDDDAMYQMLRGISMYEAAVQQARDEQAKREGKKPEEITPDLKGVNFEPALQHLQAAVKINPELWRAQYYLGRIYREQEKYAEAAEAFTSAIKNNPREQAPYVALAKMYLQWGYTDESIKVASQGADNVPGQNERSEVYFMLGMGHRDKKDTENAIKAFTHAIE